jgi:hypothetical protein
MGEAEGACESAKLLRDVIRHFLADYLRLVEAEAAAELDLANLFFPPAGPGATPEPGELSLAAQAWSHEGEKVTILVHILPLPLRKEEVSHRLRRQARSLGLRLGDPVLPTFLFLKGGRPGVNLETAPMSKLGGMSLIRVYYEAFGLQEIRSMYYLEKAEPVAWALAAFMSPPPAGPAALKWACLERIRTSHLDAARRRLLAACVEARLRLTREERKKFAALGARPR